MKVINVHNVQINVRMHVYKDIVCDVKARRKHLHKLLGYRCKECRHPNQRKKYKRLDMHHFQYLDKYYGYRKNWTKIWKYCPIDIFYSEIVPEVKECCILLCRKHHKKVHGR